MVTRILLMVLLISSCGPSASDKAEARKKANDVRETAYGHDIQVITVDSCEYVVVEGAYATAVVHKANCKNHLR
jgi:hypothetical protein